MGSMTTADAASALVARGIATGQLLGHITLAFADPADLDVPAYIVRETNTLWVQKGLPLEDVMFLVAAGLDALAGGTVVQTEDGELDVVPDVAVGAEGMSVAPERKRPDLRVVR